MTNDDRNPDADWSPRELSVLGTAALDVPPDGASERAMLALRASAVVGAGAVGIAAGTATTGAGAKAATLARIPLLLKWVGVGLVGGGAAVGVVLHERRSDPGTHEATRAARDAPPSKAGPAAPLAAAAERAEPAPPAALPAAEPLATGTPRPVERKNALADEIRAIDAARALLRGGNAKGALSELDRYEALARSSGSMRSEATIVRIEALRASGDVKRAAALGERFLRQHPKSPYAEYVRSMLARP